MEALACVFCKIVNNQDGSTRIIYEDNVVVAFQVSVTATLQALPASLCSSFFDTIKNVHLSNLALLMIYS